MTNAVLVLLLYMTPAQPGVVVTNKCRPAAIVVTNRTTPGIEPSFTTLTAAPTFLPGNTLWPIAPACANGKCQLQAPNQRTGRR